MNELQIRKRNFIALTLEGTFFFTGLAFLDANSVIPVFIDTFTGSLQLAGLATALNMSFSILAQLLTGPYITRIRNVPSYILWIMFLFRPLPFLMIPVLLGNLNPFLTVGIFLVTYAFLWGSDGLIVVPWTDLFGRTIAADRRGKLMGYQQLFGGIGGLAAGYIIKATLENPSLTNSSRYSIIFGAAGIFLLISSIAMTFAKDLPRKVSEEKVSFQQYFGQMPRYFRKNKHFSSMAFIRIISSFIGMISPFIILFGKSTFQLSPSQVSTLIYVQIIGTLVGGILWGNISHRFGNKYVILVAQLNGLVIPVLALTSLVLKGMLIPALFLWPMALLTGINMGSWMGFLNYTIDVVNEEDRPVYLVLNSVITFPLTFLTYFAGLIADMWGFLPLFFIAILAAVLGITLSLRLQTPVTDNPIEAKVMAVNE